MKRKTIVTTLLCITLFVPLSLYCQDFEMDGTARLSAPGGAPAHTHQWSEWAQVSGDNTAEERVCKSDSTHTQTRLTGTDRFSFWAIGETAYRVSAGTLTTGEVTIPAYYRPDADSEYLPVTEISNSYDDYMSGAFSYAAISSVYISEGVTIIGDYAFENCTSLASVTIPESVTFIGYSAFTGCTSLTGITLSEGVSIRPDAFSNTAWLNSQPDGLIYIDKVLYTYKGTMPDNTVINNIRADTIAIAESAFFGCENLTGITIPSGVTEIGISAFRECTGLISVTIPSSVTSIGDYAFVFCTNLTSAAIPAGVTSIGINPFARCTNFTGITVAANNPNYSSEDGILYNKNKTSLIAVPGAVSGNVTLYASITTIGNSAFSGCTSLTGITIPAGVTSIGERAFIGCTSLTSITIPTGVTSIGENTFQECTSLTSVTIPAGVTSIENEMFWGCTSLTSITIPSSVTSIGKSAFYGCKSLTSVTIPEGVTTIGTSAFSGCTSLTGITIPVGVTSISERAFSGCTSLTTITIPPSVTSIGHGAFFGCISLTGITIPAGVTFIGQQAFSGCTSLTGITIPTGVTSIGSEAFSGCNGLTSITIPVSVTSIGNRAFNNTAWLNNQPDGLIYAGKVLYTYKGAMPANTVINNIREDTIAIADYAFSNEYTNLTRITIPESVTSLGRYAFNRCTNLTSITIPSVTSIGGYAFTDCTSLTTITIPSSVTSIGFGAFRSWTNQQSINVEGHASEASADRAWSAYGGWRYECHATINYLGK